MPIEVEYLPQRVGKHNYNGVDSLTPKEMKFCRELMKNGYDTTLAAKIAGYSTPEKQGGRIVRRKSVQSYLGRHMRRAEGEVQTDLQFRLRKLWKLINDAIPDDAPIENVHLARVGLDGISELNKMDGSYAPVKNVNANLNVNHDVEMTQEQLGDLMNKYDKEY